MFYSALIISTLLGLSSGFFAGNSIGGNVVSRAKKSSFSMEYIPEGLTKEKWDEIKRREAEELKRKGNLGVLGTTRFKSRSFEAWQKAGAKHLFPVDPTSTPYEERPYMQRRNGDWEGKDLKTIGREGAGQGAAAKRLKIDDVYEVAKAEGKLDSASIFGSGIGLPWSNNQNAANSNQFNPDGKQGARGVAGKKLSPEEVERLKKNLAKVTVTKKVEPEPAAKPAPKKGFFGF